ACRCTCWTPIWTATAPRIVGSRTGSTEATRSIGSGRSTCSASAGCAHCVFLGTSRTWCTRTRDTLRSPRWSTCARRWGVTGPGLPDAIETAKQNIVFTTHTPVPAGHDYFPRDLLKRYLGGYVWEMQQPWDEFLSLGLFEGESRFCMTALALRLSSRRNGVSR